MLEYLVGAGLFVACIMLGLRAAKKVWRGYLWSLPPGLSAIADIAASACIGLGIVTLLTPLLLRWWLHGSYERFMWIISGPTPYNQLGSGPVQIWICLISLGIGIGLFGLGIAIRLKNTNRRYPGSAGRA